MQILNPENLNKHFSNSLKDTDFKKSDFFPATSTMMGEGELKELVVAIYQVYQEYRDKKWDQVKSHNKMLSIAMKEIHQKCYLLPSLKFLALSRHIRPHSINDICLTNTSITPEKVRKMTYDSALEIV